VIISAKERDVMAHACAWDHKSRGFRNYFAATPGSDDWPTLQELCARGLMRVGRHSDPVFGGMTFFTVTDAGLAALETYAAPPANQEADTK
jgi:hypothetical protein